MTLKSYFSATVESAMAQAVKDLGPDAMLIYSRETPAETRSWGRYEVVFGWEATAPGRDVKQPAAIDVAPWEARLRDADFCPTLISKVLRACAREQSEASMRDEVKHQLQRRIPVVELSDARSSTAILLTGSPGIGKTTTTAKLAFLIGIAGDRPIHLVSTDSERICGGHWLERFSALTDLAFSTADSVDALDRLIRAEPRQRTMLIDGSSWLLAEKHRRALAALRRANSGLQVHVLLPCAMRLADLRTCFSRYRPLSPDRIVAARCDEAASTGAVCSIAAEQEIPISYITHGEELADGIEPASLDRLLAPLFGVRTDDRVQPERTLAFAGGRA